jgi:hypothetical protein
VAHAPPPATHAPATQRSAPLHESDPVHAALHAHAPPTHDSPVLQPPAHPVPPPVPLPVPEPTVALQSPAASSFWSVVAQLGWMPAATTASHAAGAAISAQQALRLAHDVAVPPVPEPVPVPMGVMPPHLPLVEYDVSSAEQVPALPLVTNVLQMVWSTPGSPRQQMASDAQLPVGVAGLLDELHATNAPQEETRATKPKAKRLSMAGNIARSRRRRGSPV